MKKILFILSILSFLISFYIFNDSDNILFKNNKNIKILDIYNLEETNEDTAYFFNNLNTYTKKYDISMIRVDTFERNNTLEQKITIINDKNININFPFNPKVKQEHVSYSNFQTQDIRGTYFISGNSDLLIENLKSLQVKYQIKNYSILNNIITSPKLQSAIPIIILIFVILLIFMILNMLRINKTYFLKKIDGISSLSIFLAELKINSIYFIIYNTIFILLAITFLSVYNNKIEIFSYLFVTISFSTIFFLILNCMLFSTTFFNKLGLYENSQHSVKKTKIFNLFIYFSRMIFAILIIFILQISINTLKTIDKIQDFYPWFDLKNYVSIDISSKIPQDEIYYNDLIEKTHEVISKEDNLLLSSYNKGFEFKDNNYSPNDGNAMIISNNYLDYVSVADKDNTRIFSNNSIFGEFKYNILVPEMYKKNKQIESLINEYTDWINFITNSPVSIDQIHIEYIKNNQQTISFAFDNDINELCLKNATLLVMNPKFLSPEFMFSYLSNRYIQVVPSNVFFKNLEKNNLDKYFFSITNTINHILKVISNEKKILIQTLILLSLLLFSIIILEILLIQVIFLFKKRMLFLLTIDGKSFKEKYIDLIIMHVITDISILLCINLFVGIYSSTIIVALLLFLLTYLFFICYLKKCDSSLYS